MKVILLKDVPKLGKKFDIKEVASGHALNFLIPKGFVQIATSALVKKIEVEKELDQNRKKKADQELIKNLESIKNMTISMEKKANEKGHLFASIHKDEIVALLNERTGISVFPENIIYDKQVKEVGDHTLEVKVGEKAVKIKLIVKAGK